MVVLIVFGLMIVDERKVWKKKKKKERERECESYVLFIFVWGGYGFRMRLCVELRGVKYGGYFCCLKIVLFLDLFCIVLWSVVFFYRWIYFILVWLCYLWLGEVILIKYLWFWDILGVIWCDVFGLDEIIWFSYGCGFG